MNIEEPPVNYARVTPQTARRGLLIVNTGDGKGKSTAAFGLALRAHGRGKTVKIYQFMKVPPARWLPLDDVLATLRARPQDVHVCMTGRRCPPELMALADTVTEMTKIKHAFNAGIPAQRGIED